MIFDRCVRNDDKNSDLVETRNRRQLVRLDRRAPRAIALLKMYGSTNNCLTGRDDGVRAQQHQHDLAESDAQHHLLQ